MPHDVFLSYARVERHLALAQEALGLYVFLDVVIIGRMLGGWRRRADRLVADRPAA